MISKLQFEPHRISIVCEDKYNLPKKYIIKKDITILIWEDYSKTIVKRSSSDEYDKRLAYLTAYFQKHSGMSKNKANNYLDELKEEDEKNSLDYAIEQLNKLNRILNKKGE